MSDDPGAVDPTIAAQTTKNLALAGRFLREVLADPSIIEAIPDGASVVLIPPDDGDLAAANIALAERLAGEGRDVQAQRVGAPPDGAPLTLKVRSIRPRWPTNPAPDDDDLVIAYDRGTDTLSIDFFAGRRSGTRVAVNDFRFLVVDNESQEIVAEIVPNFLSVATVRVPRLLDLLLLSDTILVGITREEVVAIRNARTDTAAASTTPYSPSPAAVFEDLALLTA